MGLRFVSFVPDKVGGACGSQGYSPARAALEGFAIKSGAFAGQHLSFAGERSARYSCTRIITRQIWLISQACAG